MKKYAYNNLDTNLVLRGGYITLKPKTWNEVREMDYMMGSYAAVEEAKMVVIKEFDTAPDTSPPPGPAVEVVSVIRQAPGLTAEDLKAHLEAKAMKGPESLGTTTPIGKSISDELAEGSLTPPVKPAAAEAVEPVAEAPVEAPVVEEIKPAAPAKKQAKAKKDASPDENIPTF